MYELIFYCILYKVFSNYSQGNNILEGREWGRFVRGVEGGGLWRGGEGCCPTRDKAVICHHPTSATKSHHCTAALSYGCRYSCITLYSYYTCDIVNKMV